MCNLVCVCKCLNQSFSLKTRSNDAVKFLPQLKSKEFSHAPFKQLQLLDQYVQILYMDWSSFGSHSCIVYAIYLNTVYIIDLFVLLLYFSSSSLFIFIYRFCTFFHVLVGYIGSARFLSRQRMADGIHKDLCCFASQVSLSLIREHIQHIQ